LKKFVFIQKWDYTNIDGLPDIRYQIRANEEVRDYIKKLNDGWVGEFGTCIVTEEIYSLLLLAFSDDKNT